MRKVVRADPIIFFSIAFAFNPNTIALIDGFVGVGNKRKGQIVFFAERTVIICVHTIAAGKRAD